MPETERLLAHRLGKVVLARRLEEGLTQATLAELIDVSVEFVGLIERGERLPSVPTLVRLAAILGTTTDELVGGSTQAGREAGGGVVTEVATLVRKLSPELRRAVRAMLRGLHRELRAKR